MQSWGLACWQGTPRRMPGAHSHNEIEVNFVLSGGLTYLFGGSLVTLHAGQFSAFWAAVPHELVLLQEDTALFWLTLPLATFLGWNLPRALVRPLLDGHIVQDQHAADAAQLSEWHADLATGEAEREHIMLLQLEARLRRLALTLQNSSASILASAAAPGELGRVEKMTAFMAENYAAPLKIEDIARAADLHPNYAMTLFRREFGISLGEFLTRYRISHAQRLLATTAQSVLEIAFACGFGSQSRFHAAFKNLCGTSPAQYRRALR